MANLGCFLLGSCHDLVGMKSDRLAAPKGAEFKPTIQSNGNETVGRGGDLVCGACCGRLIESVGRRPTNFINPTFKGADLTIRRPLFLERVA